MALLGTLSNVSLALQRQLYRCNNWSLCSHSLRQNHCRFKSSMTLASKRASKVSITSTRNEATASAVMTDTIPHPPPTGEDKQYPIKIKNIVDEIAKLTLIEVSDLNELLKKTLNIQDAPMMAMGAVAAPQAPIEEEEVTTAKVQTAFTVKLEKFDDSKKIAVIKEIKNNIEGMNLVQAKKFVESAPQIIKADLTKDEAEKLKTVLEAVGATCAIS